MSSSNSSIDKGATKSYKYECLDCENYKRKVIEAEQTVSGRDILIEMLQGEIKKLEERYKVSIDDYELLRFKYCTVVQELSYLKEIQKKLEKSNLKMIKERDEATKLLETLQNEVLETCKNQCKEVTIELIPKEGIDITPSTRDTLHQHILKEVMNIELIMQNQNETVKDVLMKVLTEMKGDKYADHIEEVLQTTTDKNKDADKEKLLVTIKDLTSQVERLKAENESIKLRLTEKKANLAQCLDELEDNHSNLNSLSGNIEMIINEKETYLKEIGQLKNIIDENNTTIKQKDEEIYDLKNRLDSINQESRTDLKKENKNLRKALDECETELEQLQEDYLENINLCTNEICKRSINNKDDNIESDIKKVQAEPTLHKNELLSHQDKVEIATLNEKIKTLSQNLEQAKLEINVYEEDNKNYKQKVKSLIMQLQILEKEKLDTENDNLKNDDQQKELKNRIVQIEENLKTMKQENNRLIEEKDYLNNQIVNLHDELTYMQEKDVILQEKVTQLEKSQSEKEKRDNKMAELFEEKKYLENQIVALQEEIIKQQEDEKQVLILLDNLKTENKEIGKLFQENEFLKNQVVNLQNEITHMQEKDENQILELQEKIDKLENSQNEKEKELDQCCCVVKNIKATLADKNFINENNFAQITFLEDQNRKLQQQIHVLQSELIAHQNKYRGCSCAEEDNAIQITLLEDENNKLQQRVGVLNSELIAYQNKYKGCNCTDEDNAIQVTLLEDENDKLQQQIGVLNSELITYQNKYKGCNCTDENYKLQREIEVLKTEFAAYQNNSDSINIKLQNEIKELEMELCERECLNEKLQNDVKDMEFEICRRQCAINHLEQCLDKSNKILAECEKEMKQMHVENEKLKKQNESLENNLKDYIFETKRTTAEKSALQEKIGAFSRQSQALELEKYNLLKNLQEKANTEDELNQLKKQNEILLKTSQEKEEELKGMRKQTESLKQALEAGKKEHDKIIRAYKEVKQTLSDEIKKYNEETERMDKEKDNIKINLKQEAKCSACLNVKELNAIILEKQRTIKALESQINELLSESTQLKAYVSKLISDNKNLRKAIENLLATLTEKLKNFTENEENISLKSNEMIVKDILNSLMDLEKNIVEHNGVCKEKCNCMSVIKSTYKIEGKDSKVQNLSPCKQKCGKKKNSMKCAYGRDACIECCEGREKGQDDKPESYSHSSINNNV